VEVADGMIGGAKFDLTFAIDDTTDADGRRRLGGRITYATDIFDRETVTAIAERFEILARAIAADPSSVVGDIDILTAAEHREDELASQTPEPAAEPAPAYSAADLA
ncbi:hypothetical protein, partial [Leifsonia sp. SIMBA_070]|uniref:hypothetical protein n=1 Tax=Leifsonia sp. SIMBA_070 TaxID=3085810 RepID=UPI00397CFA5B